MRECHVHSHCPCWRGATGLRGKEAPARMADFQDLSDCHFLPGSEGLGFKAVGWLERGKDYSRGEVTAEFFEKLLILLQNPWAPPVAVAGLHRCEMCRFSGGRVEFDCRFGEVSFRHYRFSGVGSGFLFVPSEGTLFVSPFSIAHYIDAHEYRPPQEFQNAVAACPEMRSSAYLRDLLATPAREWLRRLDAKTA